MERYQHWFPQSETIIGNISITACNASLRAFQTAYEGYQSHAWIDLGISNSDPIYQLCQNHASCILENSSEWVKANMGTSNIILGLLPTIVAVVAPSMSELALLGIHRPLLASLLAVSTPAVLQPRVFYYEDPSEVLAISGQSGVRQPLTLGPWSQKRATIAGLCGYMLAGAAIVNTLVLVVQLTRNSVLSWGCTRTWPLFVWMFVPILVHLLACTGYSMTLQKRRTAEEAQYTTLHIQDGAKSVDEHPTEGNDAHFDAASGRSSGGTWARVRNDVLSCASHVHSHTPSYSHDLRSTKVQAGIILNTFAGFLGFMHLVFGTVAFSGLLFIWPLDAIGQVAMRLLLSALVCRMTIIFEIAGLRGNVVRRRSNTESREM